MLAIRTILHPTDFSDRSENAFRVACALARDHGGKVVVLHVAQPRVTVYGDMILPGPAEPNLGEIKKKLLAVRPPESGAQVEHRLQEGDAVEEILRVAEETTSDLIVMGTHGRTGLRRLLMGSVAEQIMRRAPCPVVTVKTPFPEKAPVPEPEPCEVQI
jgi:nucleotide-binding universal stress UspA family protein